MCTARSMADDSLVTMTAVTAADHERISGKACVQSRVCGCRSCSTNRHRRATSPRGGGCSQSLGMYNAFCFMMGVINTAATSPARCASNVHRCASTISSRPQSDRSLTQTQSQAAVRPQSQTAASRSRAAARPQGSLAAVSGRSLRPQSGRSQAAVRPQSDRSQCKTNSLVGGAEPPGAKAAAVGALLTKRPLAWKGRPMPQDVTKG
jgi:hypothetical protein